MKIRLLFLYGGEYGLLLVETLLLLLLVYEKGVKEDVCF